MKLIIHSRKHGSHTVLYDKQDSALIDSHTWHVRYDSKTRSFRARTNIKVDGAIRPRDMSTLMLCTPPGMCVDHKNHNTLDNRRKNIRVCTVAENRRNSKLRRTKTDKKYKGVKLRKDNRYEAYFFSNAANEYLGIFESEREAARAYNRAAIQHFGEFACLNKI